MSGGFGTYATNWLRAVGPIAGRVETTAGRATPLKAFRVAVRYGGTGRRVEVETYARDAKDAANQMSVVEVLGEVEEPVGVVSSTVREGAV